MWGKSETGVGRMKTPMFGLKYEQDSQGRGILGRGWAGAKAWWWEWPGLFRALVWPEHEV